MLHTRAMIEDAAYLPTVDDQRFSPAVVYCRSCFFGGKKDVSDRVDLQLPIMGWLTYGPHDE
jgi:hypothetical protein